MSSKEADDFEEEEEMDEGEDSGDESEDSEESLSEGMPSTVSLSQRSVTLQVLIRDKIIEPGKEVLTLRYLGRKFIADLLPDGTIRTPATKEEFNTPSAWASHCKHHVNPDKRSGCGWSSIIYKGKKLDAWKSIWFRKVHLNSGHNSPIRAPANMSPKLGCNTTDKNGTKEKMQSSNIEGIQSIPDGAGEQIKNPFRNLSSKSNENFPLSASYSDCQTSIDSSPFGTPSKLSCDDSDDMEVNDRGRQSKPDRGSSSIISKSKLFQPAQPAMYERLTPSPKGNNSGSSMPSSLGPSLLFQSYPQASEELKIPAYPLLSDGPLDLTPKPAHVHDSSIKVKGGQSKENGKPKFSLDDSFQEEALNLSLKPSKTQKERSLKERNTSSLNTSSSRPYSQYDSPSKGKITHAFSSDQGKITPSLNSQSRERQMEETNNNNITERFSVRHASLQERSNIDPSTQVLCEKFEDINKIQPFTVVMGSNACLLMDFHCHLTTGEVAGYLGGKWDPVSENMTISQCFPCKCSLEDASAAAEVEEDIQRTMYQSGLTLVGWYHSHPFSQPDPSVKDIDCQMSYQLKMKGSGSTYFPCVGCIIAPYNRNKPKLLSAMQMYLVMPPLESQPSGYGIPMSVNYNSHHNQVVTETLLTEMKSVVDYYRGTNNLVDFKQLWMPNISYVDKVKGSLASRLTEGQLQGGTFLDFVHHLLVQ